MRRLAPVVALTALTALTALAGTTPTAARTAEASEATQANTYRTYTACSAKAAAKPATSCPKEGKKGAFFKSVDAHVTYKVCVRFPSGKRLCAAHQDAPRGKLRINAITSHTVGEHTVTWYVAGDKVATRHFTIHN